MANNYTKTMRQALQEARSYRDTTEGGPGSGPQKGNPGKKYSDKKIKQAYGILNDPRYKQGNYSGAAKAINKLAPGLADHPDVKNALKRANENLDLSATGDTTTSNASQENETVDTTEGYDSGPVRVPSKVPLPGGTRNKLPGGMDYVGKLTAQFSKAQMDALVKGFEPLVGSERNKIKMDKVAGILKKLPKDALMQLSKANLPMVSKVAKELMK